MTKIDELYLGVDLLVAAILGFIIGYERKLRYKEAGIRTHAIVSVGSALVMIISKYAFNSDYDTSRVAAQIVSGVGFLGAGMIVYRRSGVSGLTTAAGVWTTAGVGMACGARLYVLAAFATLLIVLLQCVLHVNWKIFKKKKYYSIKIICTEGEGDIDNLKRLFKVEKFTDITATHDNGRVLYKAKLDTDIDITAPQIREIMKKYPYILSLERSDSE